ncbi:MAG: hypothetical protein HY720_03690 [Planctomycetes bacterium]|nr:hypothetical protein [Planctomycetota bacterium]
MTAFFLAVAGFLLFPVSFIYWRVLCLIGRGRAGAWFAFRFALVTGVTSAIVGGAMLWQEYERVRPTDVTDLIIRDNLLPAALLYYGVVATGVAFLFPRTNPSRNRFVTRCPNPGCGNRKSLHTKLCIRCGTRLLRPA